MGWAFCGEDTKGRSIGYGVPATCDHPGCTEKIDRGLGYACGAMHGIDDPLGSCEGYFCGKHQIYSDHVMEGEGGFVCFACAERAKTDKTYGYEESYI